MSVSGLCTPLLGQGDSRWKNGFYIRVCPVTLFKRREKESRRKRRKVTGHIHHAILIAVLKLLHTLLQQRLMLIIRHSHVIIICRQLEPHLAPPGGQDQQTTFKPVLFIYTCSASCSLSKLKNQLAPIHVCSTMRNLIIHARCIRGLLAALALSTPIAQLT